MIAPYEDGRAGPFSVQRVKDSPSSWVSQCFESALVVAGSSHGACSSPSSYRSTTFLPCAYGFQCLAQCIITTNKQVIKPDERALMSRLVEIMVAMELRFVQEKSEDGQLMYRLDP